MTVSKFTEAVELEPNSPAIFHSDRSFQYTNPQFSSKLQKHNMKQNMSRVGCCTDDGPMEGFWGILRCEMYSGKKFTSKSKGSIPNKVINLL